MTKSLKNNKILDFYFKIKHSKAIQTINKIFTSIWGIVIFAALTLLTHVLKIELALYSYVAVYVVYVCLFCDDLLPLVCLFVFCYISPSRTNNPAETTQSLFYGASGIAIIVIVAICVVSILTRIGVDNNIGFKKMFTLKRKLWLGMVILGVAYLLSGIGNKYYSQHVGSNLLFAFLQFLSIFLLYFIFSASINWDNVRKDYFAWLGVIFGITISLQIANIYFTQNVIQNGQIVRSNIITGWGIYNNIGALIAMCIPFAFYLACKNKHTYIYLAVATLLLIATVCSCSRGSILGAAVIYLACFIITFFIADNKKWYRISCGILLGLVIIFGLIFFDQVATIFGKVPQIMESNNGSITFLDSNRFELYKHGFQAFANNPIFGESFFPVEYVPYDHSKLDSFSGFFPPRWHNTIVQLLASTGIVGMLAYLYHRYETVKLIVKNPTKEKTFIGLSILALLGMSMLDCHMFNIGPVMFYSLTLAFAEFLPTNKGQKSTIDQPVEQENKSATQA